MHALFFMEHPGAIRNFESVVRLLADRGHDVELTFDSVKSPESLVAVEQLAEEQPCVTWSRTPARTRSPRALTASALRRGIDYLRYLEPRYRDAPALRERARRSAPRPIRLGGAVAGRLGAAGLLRRALARLERSLPPAAAVESFLAERRPDIVLVTPLIGIGSDQADVVRAARSQGIPTVFPVHSWDNLTNKGLVRESPDLTIVWNEAQVREAVELHGIPRDRVVATGASPYDHWFAWTPSTSPDEFADLVGLPAGPFVLWVCSSPFIAPDEVSFVRRWLAALRAEGSPLAGVGALVRPHPQNAEQWRGVSLDDERAAVWPPVGEDPLDDSSRRHYFDSVHHAAAVVGINTTAQIEGAVLGRPVHTVLADEFRATQRGTLHFEHIAGPKGHLIVAQSLGEHVELLDASLTRQDGARRRRFLETFIRPHGLDEPATPRVVDAIERAAAAPVPPMRHRGSLMTPATAVLERRLARRRRAEKAARQPEGAEAAAAAIDRFAASDGPVLAGPWLAEVGYELLYWVPFLRRAVERVPGLASRLVVVSRGGTGCWYDGIASGYLDLFDVLSPEELQTRLRAVAGETRGYRKQYSETSLDRELVATLREREGLGEALLLHPSAMFGAYRSLAKGRRAPEASGLFTFEPLKAPHVPAELELPQAFTAVRFYFSPAFPETEANRSLATAVVDGLAERGHVVVLTPPGSFDDHSDVALGCSSRVLRLDGTMTPRDNLALQTAVIGRARRFVGTYGGLSYLPLLLGVPALAFHSEPRFRERHLELAKRLSRRPGFGNYDVRATTGLDLGSVLEPADEPVSVGSESD